MSANPQQQYYQPPAGAPGQPNDHHPQHPQHPRANFQFSAEELRVLKECNRDSFYQRSLPLSTALGMAAFLGVKRGFLRPNAKWGATPKVVVGVITGYFFGKFSYQQKCAEKLMRLPNSKVGEMLRQRKRGGMYEGMAPDQGFGTGLGLSAFGSSTDSHSDESHGRNRSSALNLDTERPSSTELDDIYRPSLDAPITKFDDNLPLDPPKTSTSYDELRQRNREEYMKKMRGPPQPETPPPVERRPPPPREVPQPQDGSAQKNKYGDVWSQ
ncbi:OCIA domain-containing protein 1 isoform X2 [Phlebotomus argentipes]|uniref:OCIA domain-containing protein 1 isoform X2 n=1 Tax=Phlebotomus argentipes TaxID=94469 RepID=UPI0028929AC3|nr:OCIA domain-containing protein 1 isoform X2 [Phlebotomus argentipes]